MVRLIRPCTVLAMLAAWLVCHMPAVAADDTARSSAKEDFRAAKRDLLPKLKSKDAIERVAAIRDLQDYKTLDAAKLLVVALRDPVEDVRNTAYESLLEFKDDEEISSFLLSTLKKESRRGDSDISLPLLNVLLASRNEGIERALLVMLDQPNREAAVLPMALADKMGKRGTAESVAALAKLSRLKLFNDAFGLRRAVVDALVQINEREAIGLLIDLLPKLRGEIREAAVARLSDATGQLFEQNDEAWTKWWKENQATFQLANVPRRNEFRKPAGSLYYGFSLAADRMVFIFDTSGSMSGLRLEAAKRELLQAIDGLRENQYFGIIVFNSRVGAWQRQLVPATSQMKQAAGRFIVSQQAQGTTASYDALETAFNFDAETIYFVTDGAPVGGKIVLPEQIVQAISQLNRSRRMSINAIGIGAAGSFEDFLQLLAKENWGKYRAVNQ